MEISGRILREVEFRDRLRGYDTDEVDEFLEKVAVAVDELLAEREAAREKPARPAEPALDDESLRRTLVLAQRTADLAVREAREEATALVEEARIEAGALTAEARDEADRVRAEAEQEVHARIAALESRRVELEHEIEELDRIAATERGRLVASLSAALESLGGMARREDERQGPAGGPDDLTGAATAGETTPGEPTELIDTVAEEQDGPEDEIGRAGAVPSPTALRSRAGDRPRRRSRATQLGLADIDAGSEGVADSARPERPPEADEHTLRAVHPSGDDDPDEALWQRWARGADLDALPGDHGPAVHEKPTHAPRRGGGWPA
jgi:cell division initiation protein